VAPPDFTGDPRRRQRAAELAPEPWDVLLRGGGDRTPNLRLRHALLGGRRHGGALLNYWLFKSEPGTFGIDDLAAAPRRTTCWEGIRNYQVRNMMRDQMRRNDLAFLYHSSCNEPGIAGTVRIVRGAYADDTAFDRRSRYFDAASDPDDPRWLTVDVKLVRKFVRPVTLQALREHAGGELRDMWVLRRGNRLSITPVTLAEWNFIVGLAGERPKRN
jgi:predicted RNA-binding protein with PUA-like domain